MIDESVIAEADAPDIDIAAQLTHPPPEKTSQPDPSPSGQDAVAVLQQEFSALKHAFAEYTRQNMPEIDRVRAELRQTVAERDNSVSELNTLKREKQLNALAGDYHFNDVEYLDFILQKNNISPDNKEQTAAFMQDFKNRNPRYFILPVKSGAGSRPGSAPRSVSVQSGSRMDALEMMLSGAPEIN